MKDSSIKNLIDRSASADHDQQAWLAFLLRQFSGSNPRITDAAGKYRFIFNIVQIHIAGNGFPHSPASAGACTGIYNKIVHRGVGSFPFVHTAESTSLRPSADGSIYSGISIPRPPPNEYKPLKNFL